ncbi:LysR family transcriptional regulator [Abyssibius alkaniclasticus]|uniref:LysR family transcriptional regulator n=1 Tax=Abyssibius alkaniclasticus TaxID=2881234 RepID=UPI002364903C|nr:LysR family transcriptional regulator [Abyssibius alkaniclasticus]UPH71908.1 LysR family transcriptional regulator [Abyssibius alkaniclasticus]
MTATTHLRSLQALDMALRTGSLKAAAEELGITPAAVGQRIRAIEEFLGTDLLVRGRSGLQPTAALELAQADLGAAFAALERVSEALDFQRLGALHIVAESDWAELWLAPRLAGFREDYPNIQFCINGAGDVPVRLGAPDLRVTLDDGPGEVLFSDILLPISGPDNPRRIADWDSDLTMEGMPLLHLKEQLAGNQPGWVEWFQAFGYRQSGPDRGVQYQNARLALEPVRQEVGFLVCGLSLVLEDLELHRIVLPFPPAQHLQARHPYRMSVRADAATRPQMQRFLAWIRAESRKTERRLHALVATPGEDLTP